MGLQVADYCKQFKMSFSHTASIYFEIKMQRLQRSSLQNKENTTERQRTIEEFPSC